MDENICLVINHTGRDIEIDEVWKTDVPGHGKISTPPKGRTFKNNECTSINRTDFTKKCIKKLLAENGDLFVSVYLPEDIENKVELLKKHIDDNKGIVITNDKDNRLKMESVSTAEAKSAEEKKESETKPSDHSKGFLIFSWRPKPPEDLKPLLISIVEKRIENKRNNGSAHPSPSGEGKHFGKSEQKYDSAGLPQKNKTSADLSHERKGKNCGHGGKKDAPAGPPTRSTKKKGKTSARVSEEENSAFRGSQKLGSPTKEA